MGASISQFWQHIFGRKLINILIVGNDYAGKTTILYRLNLENTLTVKIPIMGFCIEQATYQNITFTVFDLYPEKFRSVQRQYYENVQGIIFVVDSNDDVKDCYAREGLDDLCNENQLIGVPILILANKQDLPNAMNVDQIRERLGLDLIRGRNWHIQPASIINNQGLREGLTWLSRTISHKK
ncbi:unnamed protein product [Blepharisma stoltei]|uniref:ADP-ribosylation factor n=1 Tax=Blepharisma stoltei TaxID=1481888 RepID=A0AAU9IRX3_9CILI|nr:unnamed protein product [Blepharisma stoltei]